MSHNTVTHVSHTTRRCQVAPTGVTILDNDCMPPPLPPNTVLAPSCSQTFGSRCNVSCGPGFAPEIAVINCSAVTGMFEGVMPSCRTCASGMWFVFFQAYVLDDVIRRFRPDRHTPWVFGSCVSRLCS